MAHVFTASDIKFVNAAESYITFPNTITVLRHIDVDNMAASRADSG